MFSLLKEAGLRLKQKKCQFFCRRVTFLGHIVSEQGIEVDNEKVSMVEQWPVPTTIKALRGFLGFTGYYRRYVEGYAGLSEPLTALLKKDTRYHWGPKQQEAFGALKAALMTAPILGHPQPVGSFVLDTDASGCALGGVLSQMQESGERVIAYAGKVLSRAERNYCVTRRELLAVVHFSKHFKHYLLGRPFKVRTDHSSLRWLLNFREVEGQMARWLEQLGRFDFEIEHRPGRQHGNRGRTLQGALRWVVPTVQAGGLS